MQFLGQCRVCRVAIPTYRSLAGHLRHRRDPAHQSLKADWLHWKSEYRATLRCRKCGGLWTVTDKQLSDQKTCPSCQTLKKHLSKRAYEKVHPTILPDPRKMTRRGSKAGWDGVEHRDFQVTLSTQQAILDALQKGIPVCRVRFELGIPYKVFKRVGQQLLGEQGYEDWQRDRKVVVARKMARVAHEKWMSLTPEEKAETLKKRFGKTCALETQLAGQLRSQGVQNFQMNQWQSLSVGGQKTPRESDIKIDMGDGRKVVVLCDGEAFHGPRTIFGDPKDRIQNDIQTADAFFDVGYSVVRYSESEIKSGWALQHLLVTLGHLKQGSQKIYRTWHPRVERVL